MKFTKLSLVAAVAVGGLLSNAYAADTLADAFKNGKVGGELRAYYFDKEKVKPAGTTHENIVTTGVILNYVTDSLYGFKFGTTFQSSFSPFADEGAKAMFKDDMYGSGAQASEAYLGYTLGKTEAKVGRQFLATPLIASSGSRMVRESFEGASIVNKDIPNTTLMGVYVDKFQYKTDNIADPHGEQSIASFSNVFAVPTGMGPHLYAVKLDDAMSVAAINKSVLGLTLTGGYALLDNLDEKGDANVYSLESNYMIPMNGFKLGLDALYRKSTTDSALDSYRLNGHYLGGRVGIYELAGFGASFAMGTTDKSDHLLAGVGLGTDYSYTGSLFSSFQSFSANTKSYAGKLSYDFSKVGVNGLTSYVLYAVDKQGEDTPGTKLNGGVFKNLCQHLVVPKIVS